MHHDISDDEMCEALRNAGDKVDIVDLVPLSFTFKGGPLNIKDRRPMFSELFRNRRTPKKDVYLCGRQIGKTVSTAANIVMNCTWRKDFSTVYIAPLALYTHRLDSMFLRPMLRGCTLPWPIQNTKDCTNNVLEKSFLTGSRYVGISTYSTASQALGLTADWVMFDECVAYCTTIEKLGGISDILVDMKPGDDILAFDETSKKLQPDRIKHIVPKGVRHTWRITLEDGSFLECTGNARIMCKDGWRYLAEMLPESEANRCPKASKVHKNRPKCSEKPLVFVRSKQEEECGHSRVESIEYIGEQEVYDLETEKYHTYFAGGMGVHNCQDLGIDLIPQVKEIIGTSDYRYESYFGTARSIENTLSVLYERSTQKVAHVKCSKCGKVNIPTVENRVFDMIQKHGIACVDCKELLDVSKAEWIRSYEYDPTNRDAEGYHVPQIMVEDRIKPYDRYVEAIYNKLHGTSAYSESKFLQEVLGIPTSQGGMPITQKDIQEACVLDIEPGYKIPPGKYHAVTGGADWGGSEVTSFTVGVVLGYIDGKFDVCGATRPTGLPDEIRHIAVADYMRSVSGDRLDLIGADAGFVGSVQNPNLSQYMGVPVASICYGTTKKFMIPQMNNNFTVDRTTLIFIVLTLIKQGKIRFPSGGWFGAYTRDILAIFTEDITSNNGSTLRRYSRYSDRPDDFVHALGYALFVCALRAHIDLPSMVGMSIDSSLTAPYIKYTGEERGFDNSMQRF